MSSKLTPIWIGILCCVFIINSCQPKEKYFEAIQKYMVENIDDPQKYEFVSLGKPDTVDNNFSDSDIEYTTAPMDSAASVAPVDYIDSEVVDSSIAYSVGPTVENTIESDSNKIISVLLKFRYTIQKEKFLFGKVFFFDRSGNIIKVDDQYRINQME